MPLYKSIQPNENTKILIWKITETLEELIPQVLLEPNSQLRFNTMKSEMHRLAFLSVRKLLEEIHYKDSDLYYDEYGKPHLKKGGYISISHSHQFSTIIISNEPVGIDIEMQREKIIKIAEKFSNEKIEKTFDHKYIQKMTVIWGAKEAIFKIVNHVGISFKNQILVDSFQIEDTKTNATLSMNFNTQEFEVFFQEIENYILVYVLQKKY